MQDSRNRSFEISRTTFSAKEAQKKNKNEVP
jgi:hypothetical protein